MAEFEVPMIDPDLQPDPKAFDFDLAEAMTSVVSLQSKIPTAAYTANVLGTERAGHGVAIGDGGLILTIGYLIVEAETIWLVDHTGAAVPGSVTGYDNETGFGLVQALGRINAPALPLGKAADLKVGDPVVLAGHGGRSGAVAAEVKEKREFAGYWEYLLEEAIFTIPAHPFWGGAGLIGPGGALYGIGSLFVQQAEDGGPSYDGNMVVPVDILPPILGDLQRYGRPQKPARPWIGALTAESSGHIVVVGMWDDGPAEQAGLQPGDIIVGVAKKPVSTLPELFRGMWALGDAGVEVPLDVLRTGRLMEVFITSGDRGKFYLAPKVH